MKDKAAEQEWEAVIRAALPEIAPENVKLFPEVMEDLGPPLIIYKRESRTPVDWEACVLLGQEEEIKYHWTASCTCTECEESFFAPWGKNSFYVVIGEDYQTYANFFSVEEEMTSEIKEGDEIFCPNCGEKCIAVPASNIARGRMFRTQAASLENINGTTAIIYWLYSRYLNKNGYGPTEIEPREAIAISPSGKLVRFSHMDHYMSSEYTAKKWQKRSAVREPELLQYKSEGYGKLGSYYIPFEGDMSGTTGEKTGIDAYWEGFYPSEYLKLWRKHRNIENLARSGAEELLSDCLHSITSTYQWNVGVTYKEMDKLIRWNEKKPHRMLGLRKEDYSAVCAGGWTMKILRTYQDYAELFPETTPYQFVEYMDYIGIDGIGGIREIWVESLDRIVRYLVKQAEKENSEQVPYQMFKDYRNMMLERNRIADLGELTEAEKYPPVLRRAHDRIAREHNERLREENRQRQQNRNVGDVAVYAEKFRELREEYSALEYSDGEICIVVPQSPVDLIREGHILNHCVGGYSSQHCSGRPIFFVRHARRPERSWFTLNEDLTGDKAHRIQLHGYGNEYANGHRLKIPKKVLGFVSKWEREILTPWYEKQKRQNKKKKGKETAA